uniref:Uncharacterized protein n=1 Tax=Parascaris univalens TaxID=6257 RepID=A0A915BKT1_PARUN
MGRGNEKVGKKSTNGRRLHYYSTSSNVSVKLSGPSLSLFHKLTSSAFVCLPGLYFMLI